MIQTIDHLIIAVRDIELAKTNYTKLFGMPPVWHGAHKELGTINSIFNFENTYLELLSADGQGPGSVFVNYVLEQNGEGLAGLAFGTKDMDQTLRSLKTKANGIYEPSIGEGQNFLDHTIRKWKTLFLPPKLSRGLFSFVIEHTEGELPPQPLIDETAVHRLDHVVLKTSDANGFITIFRDVLNIRLALDKTVDGSKSRMLFFRLNKTTIEVIEQNNNESGDKLWGLAWAVKSIAATRDRLLNDGVDVTPIKRGLKENTLVATVKSHTHKVPTLLIEHTA